jgi:hypothetical protein
VILAVFAGSAIVASAQTYDAKADFSATRNPTGPWTHGWSEKLGGALTVYTMIFYSNPSNCWGDASIEAAGAPFVGYNAHDYAANNISAHSMCIASGPGNEFSHCRWTAPAAGNYSIRASFTAVSFGGPHGYVLKNGVAIADSLLTENVPWSSSFSSVSLAAGDTIDAASGVGTNNVFQNDTAIFSLTITKISPPVPGPYRALISGSGAPEGILTAQLQASGTFAAVLDIRGTQLPLSGTLSQMGLYSTTLTTEGGKPLGVSFGFAGGNLTGTSTYDGETSLIAGGVVPGGRSAPGGAYAFTISPSPALATGTVPEGVGFGRMQVRSSGEVSITGTLADGASFSTLSSVTSGTSIPIYIDLYKPAAGSIGGTIVFNEIPGVSDCQGTLVWTKPAIRKDAQYPQGFQLSAQVEAVRCDSAITGLNGDEVSFSASGAGLQTAFSANVTLKDGVPSRSMFGANTTNLHLAIDPAADTFFGSFEDSTTHKTYSFSGTLLPKSRTGAGFFLSGGQSGSVNIGY